MVVLESYGEYSVGLLQESDYSEAYSILSTKLVNYSQNITLVARDKRILAMKLRKALRLQKCYAGYYKGSCKAVAIIDDRVLVNIDSLASLPNSYGTLLLVGYLVTVLYEGEDVFMLVNNHTDIDSFSSVTTRVGSTNKYKLDNSKLRRAVGMMKKG